jgi:hypothetical protein
VLAPAFTLRFAREMFFLGFADFVGLFHGPWGDVAAVAGVLTFRFVAQTALKP